MNVIQVNNENDIPEFRIILSLQEKIECLEGIVSRLKKVLYVYDKSQEYGSNYNYKVFCGGILLYIASSNDFFNGELINVIVNINAIINNDFTKDQIKRLVFESKNNVEFLLKSYKNQLANSEKDS